MSSSKSKWWNRFVDLAGVVASWSKDPSTKCGAVIVDETDNTILAVGFNGFPRDVYEVDEQGCLNDRWDRPGKYDWVEHGERNAIYNAARNGVSVKGATMFLNWSVQCCSDCARAIVQSGIKRVVGSGVPFPGKGNGVSYNAGLDGPNHTMFKEAGVEVYELGDE